mmetsp:Transcript_118491/g.166599  ORF Transcript_118491/g.166599 Transcript_118491/m.166599 type:complete len:256 (+) Transcript_118491:2-769(+)
MCAYVCVCMCVCVSNSLQLLTERDSHVGNGQLKRASDIRVNHVAIICLIKSSACSSETSSGRSETSVPLPFSGSLPISPAVMSYNTFSTSSSAAFSKSGSSRESIVSPTISSITPAFIISFSSPRIVSVTVFILTMLFMAFMTLVLTSNDFDIRTIRACVLISILIDSICATETRIRFLAFFEFARDLARIRAFATSPFFACFFSSASTPLSDRSMSLICRCSCLCSVRILSVHSFTCSSGFTFFFPNRKSIAYV